MLATFPITKTSASRLTPELRDNAAFGAVFSDHMLVADLRRRQVGRAAHHSVRRAAAGRRAGLCALRPGHLRRLQGVPASQRRRGGLPSRRQSRAHGEDLPAHGDAGSAGVDLHRRHARARPARSQLDSREGQQRPLRPPRAVCHRRVARREAVGILPLRDRDLPERAVFHGLGGSDRGRHLRARVSRRHRRGQVRRQLRRQHARRRSRRRRKGSTTCCGSTASSASTSRKRA